MIDNENDIQGRPERRRMERMSYAEKGRFFAVRNILNTIFILVAVIGMAIYFYKSREIGGTMLIGAVVIKLAECVLRIIR